MTRGQELVSRPVFQVDGLDIRRLATGAFDIGQCPGDHGQGFQPQEVKLHQPRRLDPFHVELGSGNIGSRIAIKRHQLGELAITDHHTGSVGRGIAVKAFQFQRRGQQAVDRLVLGAHLAQPWFDLQRLGQGHRVGGVGRDQLGELVDQAEGQLQHPADIAHHGAGLQRTEGNDLGHPVMAVLLLHIADHLAAPLLAEVDVEIRHGDAFGIEETLEQQTEAQRIKIGNGQRIGDQRAGTGTATRADGDIMSLGPLDKVRDDEEITREAHLLDDVELEIEPVTILLLAHRRRTVGDAVSQTLMGAGHKLLGFIAPALGGKARQDRRVGADPVGAAPGDLERVLQRLGQIGETLTHFIRRGQMVLVGDLAPVGDGDIGTTGDTQQRIMCLVHAGIGEIGLIRSDQRQVAGIGFIDQPVFRLQFLRPAMALQFDIEAIAKGLGELSEDRLRFRLPSGCDQGIDDTVRPATQGNQTCMMLQHHAERHMRLFGAIDIEIGGAGERHEIVIAFPVLGIERQRAIGLGALAGMWRAQAYRERAADDGLHTTARHDFGKFERTEQVVAIGQRDGRHAIGLAGLSHFGDADRPLKQRIGRADAQMHKGCVRRHD